jgi:hypothetical protein
MHADDARERVARAEEASADAHDRAAALHEKLRLAGIGDAEEHRRSGEAHRQAAEYDRQQAAERRRKTSGNATH